MPLTEAQYKALIPVEVGDDAAGSVASNIDTLWTKNDDQPDLFTRYLTTKRDAIGLLMGRVRQMVSFHALSGASVNLSDLMKNLETMLAAVNDQIVLQAEQLRSAALAPLTTTTPTTPPAGWPDANDPQYKGSPYTPGVRGSGRTPI